MSPFLRILLAAEGARGLGFEGYGACTAQCMFGYTDRRIQPFCFLL